MITGIDVSHHQGTLDWAALKKCEKVNFAIIRAGYGRVSSQKDKQFEANYKGSKAQGIPVGAYWYSYATTVDQAKLEAQTFLQTIKGKTFEYPLFFDQEYEPGIVALTNAQRTAICKAFCSELEKAGYYAGIYCSSDWMNSKLNYKELSEYDHWAAQYGKTCTSKHVYGIWQYSSENALNIPGFGKSLDCNYCYKDYPTIIKKAGLNGYGKKYTATIGPMDDREKYVINSKANELDLSIKWEEKK